MNSNLLAQTESSLPPATISNHQYNPYSTNIQHRDVVEYHHIQNQISQLQILTQEYRLAKYYNESLGLSKKYYCQLKKLKITKTSQNCSICQYSFKKEELVIQFPCKHIFHKEDCVKGWLKVSSKCPICKLDLEEYFRKKQVQNQSIEQNGKNKKTLENLNQKNGKRELLKYWIEKQLNENKVKSIEQIKL